jgi:hypothetical protein
VFAVAVSLWQVLAAILLWAALTIIQLSRRSLLPVSKVIFLEVIKSFESLLCQVHQLLVHFVSQTTLQSFTHSIYKGTVTIMVLANALSYQNASGPFNNGPTELT